MRPYYETNSKASTAAVDVGENLLTVISQALQGAWFDIVAVILAMLVLASVVYAKRAKGDKVPCTCERQGVDQGQKIRKAVSSNRSRESQRIQRLVVGLLQRRGNIDDHEALLQEYELIVKDCGAQLLAYIPDDNNARSMYIGLIGCAIASTTSAAVSDSRERIKSRSVSSTWSRIASLLTDMQTLGVPRNVDFYTSILKMILGAELVREALLLYEIMKGDNIAPNSAMLVSLLNVAVCCDEPDKALIFFEAICTEGAPSVRTIMTVLRVYSKSRNWKEASRLLVRMESLGTPPDNIVLNHVLGLFIEVGEIDGAEQLLLRWKDIIDVISCNIILKGYAQQGNLSKAEDVLSRMVSSGPTPNLISYNTVMDCAVRSMQKVLVEKQTGQHTGRSNRHAPSSNAGTDGAGSLAIKHRPWALLDEMLSMGLEPDRYTCSTLVKGMHLSGCSTSDIDRAVGLLRRIGASALQMPGAGSSSSSGSNERLLEVLFNTLLDACISVQDLDRMASIFSLMQEYHVNLSAVTYGTLIKAFGQAGYITRCHEAWSDLRKTGIHPTIVTYGCYIDACIRNSDIDAAEHIFETMSQGTRGVRPNAVVYTSMIRGYTQASQPRKALDLYHQMRRHGIAATAVTFNSILDVVARQLAEPEILQEIIDDMCKANVTPDVVTYSILIKASCSAGHVQSALSLFRQLQKHGLAFDPVGFNTLLMACSKADQISDAEHIFQEMLQLGMSPTPVTASIIVKMYGKAKMLDKAFALSDLLETEHGQRPNLYVFTCLIQACVQNKQVRRSWDIFKRMVQNGVEPDAITYGTMLHGLVYLNKFEYAMSLVRRAYRLPPKKDDSGNPFSALPPLKKLVPLQSGVMQMLLSAVKRKEQAALAVELEQIFLDFNVGSSEATPQPRKRNTRGAGLVSDTRCP